MDLCADVLLREVNDSFGRFAEQLDLLHPLYREELVRHPEYREELVRVEHLVRQLWLLEWRSRDVRNEFAEFYSVRLLLDHQSPLASYFIDLFSQLHWMLCELHETCRRSISGPDLDCFERMLRLTQVAIRPAIGTCRFLYAAYRMLPRSRTLQGLDEQRTDQFKRERIRQRHGRRFSWNELHCRLRKLGFVNLDGQGSSMVHLSAQLGKGGSGATVYRGDFKSNDENGKTINIGDPVAVKMFSNSNKMFSNSNSNSTKFSRQFWQSMEHMTQHHEQISCMDQFTSELGRLVSVRHPNIVILRGYIGKRPEGESGLVMELMDESLHDYLEKVNKGYVPALQEFDMLDLMLEIAKGMQYVHECNLVHRDLNPRNVLLRLCTRDHKMQGCKFLEVKLADFGLTKLCGFSEDGSTKYTEWRGTSCYMAPELRVDGPLQELPADEIEKVDIFSYGTTCLNILLCNPNNLAFSSQSIQAFYEAVKTGKWKQWVGGIDEHMLCIVKLIARCWEWEPARRPTFAALCVLLQNIRAFLLSDQYLHKFQSQLRNKLQTLHKEQRSHEDHTFQYSHVYQSIVRKCLGNRVVKGVKLIRQCLHDFESNISAATCRNRSSLENEGRAFMEAMKKVVETSDLALDFSILLEKGYFKVIGRSKYGKCFNVVKRTMYRPSSYNLNKLMDDLDPILFIDGLACCKVAMEYDQNTQKTSSSLLSYISRYEEHGFDFTNDGALCELTVDVSVLPLLVTFWSIPTDLSPSRRRNVESLQPIQMESFLGSTHFRTSPPRQMEPFLRSTHFRTSPPRIMEPFLPLTHFRTSPLRNMESSSRRNITNMKPSRRRNVESSPPSFTLTSFPTSLIMESSPSRRRSITTCFC